MTVLQDLVLESSPEFQAEPLRASAPIEALFSDVSALDILAECKLAEDTLDPSALATLAARLSRIDAPPRGDVGSGELLFSHLFHFLQDPSSEVGLRAALRLIRNRLQLALLIADTPQMLHFLDGFWGDEAEGNIARFLDVDQKTVAGWFHGKEPAQYNQEILSTLTIVLYQASLLMPLEDAATWFETPSLLPRRHSNEKSPWWVLEDKITRPWDSKHMPVPSTLKESLEKMGADPVVWDDYFRRRFWTR